jgi:hypothetical protein
MNEDELKKWLKENLCIEVSIRTGDGCPEEGIPGSLTVRVSLLLADGTEIDNDEADID